MDCAVCEMWGMKRAATHVGPWSDTGEVHGRCRACMAGIVPEGEGFEPIASVASMALGTCPHCLETRFLWWGEGHGYACSLCEVFLILSVA